MASMDNQMGEIRELTEDELASIGGGVLAYDLGYALGNAVGGAFRTGLEYMMNEPFRRQY